VKLYNVIYCDPPWRYANGTPGREVERHYPTMSDEELCALVVPAADDCVLWLWATAPRLDTAMRLIEAWGFRYKTCAVWDKQTMGMGYWFRGQHELLLVATCGNVSPPTQAERISSIIRVKRAAHSDKPDQVRAWIASWYPTASKLEMFARPYTGFWPKHDGWDTWGNELANDVEVAP